MYYVKTEKPGSTLTTSYVTEKQARRYGGEPIEAHPRLVSDGISTHVIDYDPDEELIVLGTVRTIYQSKYRVKGNFLLFLKNDDGKWYWPGISFSSMSDANQAVKGPLSATFSDMIVVEVADDVDLEELN